MGWRRRRGVLEQTCADAAFPPGGGVGFWLGLESVWGPGGELLWLRRGEASNSGGDGDDDDGGDEEEEEGEDLVSGIAVEPSCGGTML